jgi:hypothetical protein
MVGDGETLGDQAWRFGFDERVDSSLAACSGRQLRVRGDLKPVLRFDRARPASGRLDVEDLAVHVEHVDPALNTYAGDLALDA